jgi:hypothetical protein
MVALIISLLLAFTSPTALPIELAASGAEISAVSEQRDAAMCADVVSIHVVRVVVTLHDSLYKQRSRAVEVCSTTLQRIIYGVDYDYTPLTIRNDGLYCLLYPKRH